LIIFTFTFSYGDFAPIKFRARLAAIVWMLISLVMGSLLTGSLVTAFTVQSVSVDSMYGTKVSLIFFF